MSDKYKADPTALKSILWGFWGVLLGPFGAIPAIFYGHSFLLKYKRNSSKFEISDKKMAQGGLLFGYINLCLCIYLLYYLIKLLNEL